MVRDEEWRGSRGCGGPGDRGSGGWRIGGADSKLVTGWGQCGDGGDRSSSRGCAARPS